jgi:hypothetical protein
MSFLEVLKVHKYLDELFLRHQEALLRLDIELAAERLMFYERELRRHMRVEEEWLLPVPDHAAGLPDKPVDPVRERHGAKVGRRTGRRRPTSESVHAQRSGATRNYLYLNSDQS